MKSLDEYNKDKYNIPNERQYMAGVKCDKCETEMVIENPHVVLASYPAQQWVVCPKCNHRGLKVL